jgi:hypothetical protein
MNLERANLTIGAVLAALGPLPVLFSHKCNPVSHALHAELGPYFESNKMLFLQCDPFKNGEHLTLKMGRLPMNGVVFYCTDESNQSKACERELATARRMSVPIMVIADDEASPPPDLKQRLYPKLPGLTGRSRSNTFNELADQMQRRSRVHAVLQWLSEAGRTVEEREDGCAWLCEQPAQILAEFLKEIAQLHRGKDEDNIVCRTLATVLGLTATREAIPYLEMWLALSTHPNARYGCDLALQALQ